MNVAGRQIRVRWKRVGGAVLAGAWAVSLPWVGRVGEPYLDVPTEAVGLRADVYRGLAAWLVVFMIVTFAMLVIAGAVGFYRDVGPLFIEIDGGDDA